MSCLACARRPGFTLTELLTVLFIISILAGLILGAMGSIRRQAKEKATANTLLVLSSALERYALDFSDYPPSSADPDKGAFMLYKCLMTDMKEGPYAPAGDVKVAVDERSGETYFADEWQRPIRYLHRRDYRGEEIRKDSFRLMSAGADSIFEAGETSSDDIVNWDKSKPGK